MFGYFTGRPASSPGNSAIAPLGQSVLTGRRSLGGAVNSLYGSPVADLYGEKIISTIYPGPYSGPAQLDKGGSETEEMRRMYDRYYREEPAIRSAIRGKVDAISGKPVSVLPSDKRKPMDVLAAEFCQWAIEETDHGFGGLFDAVLTPGLVHGVSYTEPSLIPRDDWPKMREIGLSSVWSLDKTRSLNVHSIRLRLDQFYNVIAIVNLIRGLEYFSPSNVILYTHNGLYNNPFGQSDLRACHRAAGIIDNAYKAWYTAAKIFGLPYMVAKGPAQRIGILKDVMKALRGGGYAVIEEKDSIEAINLAASSGTSSFGELIKTLREDIFLAIRGAYTPFLEGQGGTGAHNDTQVSEDQANDGEIALIEKVCRVVRRQLFPWLVGPNFPKGTGIPHLKIGGTDWDKTTKFVQAVTAGQAAGGKFKADWFYETAGFVAADPADPNDALTPQQPGQGGPPGGGGGPPGLPPGPGGNGPPALPPSPTVPGGTVEPPAAPKTTETFADASHDIAPERIAALADQLIEAARGKEGDDRTFADHDVSGEKRDESGKWTGGGSGGGGKSDDAPKPSEGKPPKVPKPRKTDKRPTHYLTGEPLSDDDIRSRIAAREKDLHNTILYRPGSTSQKKLISEIKSMKRIVGDDRPDPSHIDGAKVKDAIDKLKMTLKLGQLEPHAAAQAQQQLDELENIMHPLRKIDTGGLKESIGKMQQLQDQAKAVSDALGGKAPLESAIQVDDKPKELPVKHEDGTPLRPQGGVVMSEEAKEDADTPDLSVAAALLAALKAADDDDAADYVAELMEDPERADELAELLSDDDSATFASAHKDGETWQTGRMWFKREGGKTRRTRDPNAKAPEPKPERAGPTLKERLIAGKAEKEPARQAAREAYAKAKEKPHELTHADVPALVEHLDKLTKAELREHAREAMERLGGLKADIVRRLVEKLTGHSIGGPPAEKELPTATPELATHLKSLITAVGSNPYHVDDAHMDRIVTHLKSLPKAQQKAVTEAALGYPVKSAQDGLERIETKLTGTRRMLERQRV